MRGLLIAILAEADARGAIDPANLAAAFEDTEEKRRLDVLFQKWREVVALMRLDQMPMAIVSETVEAMTQNGIGGDGGSVPNMDSYAKALEILDLINREFLTRACRRLGELQRIPLVDLEAIEQKIPSAAGVAMASA